MNILRVLSHSVLGICTLIAISACSTRQAVVYEYSRALKSNPANSSNRTVIVFLIDGLPFSLLKEEVESNNLPNIYDYFLKKEKKIFQAKTVFPSLTYPALTSLLSESPVSSHGVYGNRVLQDTRFINFEEPGYYVALNTALKKQNIFTRLKQKGLRTVSLDYAFHADATAHTQTWDTEAGVAILEKNYFYIDEKQLESLESILTENRPEQWPDFVFIHIIGLDFTTHDQGVGSEKRREYLQEVDKKMGDIFNVLKAAEANKKKEIVAFLTSDHGFDNEITKILNIEESLAHEVPEAQVLNEGRFVSLTFPRGLSLNKRMSTLKSYVQNPDIDIVALKDGNKVYVQSQKINTSFYFGIPDARTGSIDVNLCKNTSFKISFVAKNPQWVCPEKLSEAANSYFYPFFLQNLSYYFFKSEAPDAIILSKPGIAFHDEYSGQHGGPTIQETVVPLLMRNSAITTPNTVPSLFELLEFM